MSKKIEFNKPPVMEVVIGAQFEGLVFDNSFIYNFYQTIKKEFPKIQENPSLPSIIAHPSKPNITKILQGFTSRKFFINNNGDKLIQLQADKLLFNWRKNSERDEYPKFSSVLGEFLSVYEKTLSAKDNVQEKLNQLEVTFVDHINLRDFNLEVIKLEEIFNYITIPDEIKNLECMFNIPQEKINGSLTLSIKSAVNNKDQSRIIVCETTCRGNKEEKESLSSWYEKAHNILLDFFINLFTEKSKTIWGEKK